MEHHVAHTQGPADLGNAALVVTAHQVFLLLQIQSGAEVVQLFDSWAGALPPEALRRWSLEPLTRITRALKERHAETPVMLFPRGAGLLYPEFAACGADALSLDSSLPPAWAHLDPSRATR